MCPQACKCKLTLHTTISRSNQLIDPLRIYFYGKTRGNVVIREVFHTGKIIKGVQEEAAPNAASHVCHEKPYEYKNHKERATFNWTGLHHCGSGQGEGSFPPGLERPIVSLRHQRH